MKDPKFTDTLAQLRHGSTSDELDAELAACIAAASLTGKAATLTVKITVKPQGNSGVYTFNDKVTSSIPVLDREATVLFQNADGDLVREDPRQQKMNFQDVSAPMPSNFKDVPETKKPFRS